MDDLTKPQIEEMAQALKILQATLNKLDDDEQRRRLIQCLCVFYEVPRSRTDLR